MFRLVTSASQVHRQKIGRRSMSQAICETLGDMQLFVIVSSKKTGDGEDGRKV